jgi:hypothetical protein
MGFLPFQIEGADPVPHWTQDTVVVRGEKNISLVVYCAQQILKLSNERKLRPENREKNRAKSREEFFGFLTLYANFIFPALIAYEN